MIRTICIVRCHQRLKMFSASLAFCIFAFLHIECNRTLTVLLSVEEEELVLHFPNPYENWLSLLFVMNTGTNSPQSSIMMEGIFFGVLCLSGCLTFSTCLLRQYHFVSHEMSWTEAQSYCRGRYTDLATIENTEEMMKLKDTVSAAVHSSEVWIGLYRQIDWKWSDGFTGSGAGYRNWTGSEPNYNKAKELCVGMWDHGGWIDVDCHRERAFVCYNGTLEDSDFELVNTPKTWTEAQRHCREHYTDLVTVRNKADKDKIQNLMGHKQQAWIGLYRDPQIYWSDGSCYSFSFWYQDKHKLGSMKVVCGVADLQQGGKWRLLSCEERFPFVCYSVRGWCFL